MAKPATLDGCSVLGRAIAPRSLDNHLVIQRRCIDDMRFDKPSNDQEVDQ
jgi:hypothetical protein